MTWQRFRGCMTGYVSQYYKLQLDVRFLTLYSHVFSDG